MNPSSQRNDQHKPASVSGTCSNKQAEEVLRNYGKSEGRLWSEKMLRTLARGAKGRNWLSAAKNVNRAKTLSFAEHVVLSLKAMHREAVGLRNGVKH